jgi:putative flippase GtrA
VSRPTADNPEVRTLGADPSVAGGRGALRILLPQLVRYAAVGVSNVAIDVGVLTFLVRTTGIVKGPLLGGLAAIAASCAVLNSYFWNCRWTFGERLDPRRQFIPFIAVQAISVAITAFVVSTLTLLLARQPVAPFLRVYEAKAAALIVTVIWNFSALRLYVFRKRA